MPILHWLNRDESIRAAARAPYRLLEADPKLSYGDAATENMLIQGDNLHALKALLPYYAGKVKCIFIDPPYNTKSAFEHYEDNLEHTRWLEMMYPRLELLRDLLAEDGSIWVTIDDNEAHYLKVIMDEVFGRKNFISTNIWEKRYSPQNAVKWFSESHDFIIVYAKHKEKWHPNLLERSDEMNARYRNLDNDPRGVWKPADSTAQAGHGTQSQFYVVTAPNGKKHTLPSGRCWVYTEPVFQAMVADNRIWFGSTGNNVPAVKRFLSEVKQGVACQTIWKYGDVGHNQEAKKEIIKLNSDAVFDTPKPERLLQRVIHLATGLNDLVLDSFLGSGTTAAVAHKMGRRYIGIEMGEHADTHCQPRLKKVVDGEQGGISKAVDWQGGSGFRFYRLGEAVFDETGQIQQGIRFEHLAAHIWFSETRRPLVSPPKSPLLGIHNEVAYYLLYNGILGDKRPQGGNVLTSKTLATLPPHPGKKVIYGETSRLGASRLEQHQITFKQTPYDIKAR